MKKKPNNKGISHFLSTFMAIVYKIINKVSPPRVLPQQTRIIQLSKDVRVGDWYYFWDHVEIRVYGSKLPPYQLLVFMPMIIFYLDFIKRSLNTDQIHFVFAKKGYIFKLPMVVGPFVVNSKKSFQ